MYNQYLKLLEEAKVARDQAADYIKETQAGSAYSLAEERFKTHLRLQKFLKGLSETEIRSLASQRGISIEAHSLSNLIRMLGRADRMGNS